MPKQKTHSGAGKRFKYTSTGEIKRSKQVGMRHNLGKKTAKQKRRLNASVLVLTKGDKARIARLMYN